MSRNKTLAAWIAETSDWAERADWAELAENNLNAQWGPIARARLDQLVNMLPSGSGIDRGTKLVSASASRIVLECSFHHMNDCGMYDGWTEHRITIRPMFSGLELTISGRNRNDIKEYLHVVYHDALSAMVTETVDLETREATYTDERYARAE